MRTDLREKINKIATDFSVVHLIKNKTLDDIYELFMNDLLGISTDTFDVDMINDKTLRDILVSQLGSAYYAIKPETIDDIILMIRQYNELK